MIKENKSYWEREYMQNTPMPAPTTFKTAFQRFLASTQEPGDTPDDQFTAYIEAPQLPLKEWNRDNNLFTWWMQSEYSDLRQWAFDTLSVPAMSAEVERIFSQARRTITTDRNRLSNEMAESLLCMKHWLDSGILED